MATARTSPASSPARACCPAGATRAWPLAFTSRCSRCSTRRGRDARVTWCSPSTISCETASAWVSTSSTSRLAIRSSSRPSPIRWCRPSSRRRALDWSWWRRPATAASTRSPANPVTRALRLPATRHRPSRWAHCSRRGQRRGWTMTWRRSVRADRAGTTPSRSPTSWPPGTGSCRLASPAARSTSNIRRCACPGGPAPRTCG